MQNGLGHSILYGVLILQAEWRRFKRVALCLPPGDIPNRIRSNAQRKQVTKLQLASMSAVNETFRHMIGPPLNGRVKHVSAYALQFASFVRATLLPKGMSDAHRRALTIPGIFLQQPQGFRQRLFTPISAKGVTCATNFSCTTERM